jgi:hypothetical protein
VVELPFLHSIGIWQDAVSGFRLQTGRHQLVGLPPQTVFDAPGEGGGAIREFFNFVALLQLGAGEAGTSLPSSLAWWRDFALRFVADLCAL